MNILVTLIILLLTFSFCFRILRWATTPILRKAGFYTYYAPLFFIQPFGRNQCEIHLGTTWDLMWARQLTARVLMSNLVQGVSGIVADAKKGRLERTLKLRATTYFLSEQTLLKYGFTVRQPNVLEYVAFLGNYVEVCILRSIVAGRPQLVDIRQVRMAETTLQQLVDRETLVGPLMRRIVTRSREDF